MKRMLSVLEYILFILIVLLPSGKLLSNCFGYTFELASVTAFAGVTALFSICLVILSIKEKEMCESSIMKVLFSLLTPLSIINAVFYMLENSKIWVIACMFICIGCCLFLTMKYGKPLVLKIITLTVSALMVLPICFFSFFVLTFGNMGVNTVVKSIKSPNGAYYAEVIDSDQGALGGDTLVYVYKNKEINALAFKIFEQPQRAYQGEWGEFENMDIYWKNDSCLVINSVEYEIE